MGTGRGAPVLRRLSKRREVSSLVAVTPPLDGASPRLYARHFLGAIHGEEVIAGLRHFGQRIGRPLVIVWDHFQAHRARCVRDFVARHRDDVQVEWLPAYAPGLNPEEPCNNAVKLASSTRRRPSARNSRTLAHRKSCALDGSRICCTPSFAYVGLSVT